ASESRCSVRTLVVQNYVEKGAVDLQSAVVVNKSQFSEAVHEEAYSRAGSADHFRQCLLADPRDYGFRNALLAEMQDQKEDSGQPLFTRIEKLIDQIFFVTDVPRQQIGHEHFGNFAFAMKRFHHGFLFDSQNGALRHCGGRAHTERLARKRAFTEKVSLTQYANGCFLASLRDHGESYLAGLDVKYRVSSLPLREDGFFPREEHKFPALADAGKKCAGIKILLVFGAFNWSHR